MNTANKFNGRAKDYAAGRPSYSPELVEFLYENYKNLAGSVVADIGSGTGMFAKLLLDRGSEVYGVEPNSDMRNMAVKRLGGYEKFHAVAGSAEHTALADGSVDYVTVAQAFHWFDVDKFRQECRRILKCGGRVFLVWNVRSASDSVNQELGRIFSEYCPSFKGFSNGIERDDERIKAFFGGAYDYVSFDYRLDFDREKFIARCLSSSYSLRENDINFEPYYEALNGLFDRYADDGIVSVANSSTAYIGSVDKYLKYRG